MTDPRLIESAPPAGASGRSGPFHADGAREHLVWPATLGVLLTLLLAWVALVFVPAPWSRLAAGGAVVTGVLVITVGSARAARRWVEREARAVADQLPTTMHFVAPGRPDPASLPPLLRHPIERAVQRGVEHARVHDAAHADADHAALGENAAARLEQLVQSLGRAVEAYAVAHGDEERARAMTLVQQSQRALDALVGGLRRAAAPPAAADGVHDVAAHVAEVGRTLQTELGGAALSVRTDGATAPVRLHLTSFIRALDGAVRAAIADSAPASASLHVVRMRRAAYEEEPVRRTDDSPRTIVPRIPQGVVREWVAATQPPAELLCIVVADAAHALDPVDRARALDPFGVERRADPLGLALADLRRVVQASRGCIWLDDAREGGTAVHVLLPIAIAP
ncbi:MAG: hypothetical protein MUF40_07540 [Gemmatimonadaceae bacterium]|nr:hypothetical protein [Gemmatimonadaceae bacterium]